MVAKNPLCRLLQLTHEAAQVVTGTGNRRCSDGGGLPRDSFIQFRDRDIESVAQLLFQAPHHLPTVLQRAGVLNVNFEDQRGDGHEAASLSPRPGDCQIASLSNAITWATADFQFNPVVNASQAPSERRR